MSNLYLKFPTIEDKDRWLNYIEEYEKKGEELPLHYMKNDIYECWLEYIINASLGIDLEEGRVPFISYFLMDDSKIIGDVSIKTEIHDYDYSGHVGGGIRPSERKKGYATKLLGMSLEKCKHLGMEDVLVSCDSKNIASSKLIKSNGGELREVVYDIKNKRMVNVYNISVANKHILTK